MDILLCLVNNGLPLLWLVSLPFTSSVSVCFGPWKSKSTPQRPDSFFFFFFCTDMVRCSAYHSGSIHTLLYEKGVNLLLFFHQTFLLHFCLIFRGIFLSSFVIDYVLPFIQVTETKTSAIVSLIFATLATLNLQILFFEEQEKHPSCFKMQ